MSTSVQFVIPGPPVSKGRPRFTKQGYAYTPKKTKDAEVKVMVAANLAMKEALPSNEPIRIKLTFFMSIPKSYPEKQKGKLRLEPIHTKRPDLDNLIKLILDALNGICWVDDSQIISISAIKLYATDDIPRTEIWIGEWEKEMTPTNPPYEAEGVSGGNDEDEIGDLIG